MTDVLAVMQAAVATLDHLVDAPEPDAVAYGSDLDCVQDCPDGFPELDPNSPIGIAQAAIRALDCPRGGCPDEPNYGLYLPGYVNRGVTQADLRELNGLIIGELRKDDRIADLTVQLSYDATASKALTGSIQITPEDSKTGPPFTLTFSVTGPDVLLETIS